MPGVKGKSGGHNRKTNREKELLGAAKRRLEQNAPAPLQDQSLVISMDGLGEAGRLYYEKVMAALKANGTMGDGEELGLHGMARLVEDWAKADERVRKSGRLMTYAGKNGTIVKVAPWHTVERQLWADLIEMQREYGLTPLSRDRVRKISKGDEINDYKRLTE